MDGAHGGEGTAGHSAALRGVRSVGRIFSFLCPRSSHNPRVSDAGCGPCCHGFAGISDFTPADIDIVGYRVFLGNGQYFVSSDVGNGKMQW